MIPNWLLNKTFVLEYNPNCISPYLVRMPGKSGVIDKKQYTWSDLPLTGDALGFGQTLEEAAEKALKNQEKLKKMSKV